MSHANGHPPDLVHLAPAQWLRARDLFDRGEWYELHEVLEVVWLPCPPGAEREFMAVMILVAAALHKRRVQGDPLAAAKILARAEPHGALVPRVFAGIDRDRLLALGRRGVEDPSLPLTLAHAAVQGG